MCSWSEQANAIRVYEAGHYCYYAIFLVDVYFKYYCYILSNNQIHFGPPGLHR